MMTLATVEFPEVQPRLDDLTIYVDIDDSGWAYIKQGSDWIAFPAKRADDVIRALQNIWR